MTALLSKFKRELTAVAAIVGALVTIVGAAWGFDARYSLKYEFAELRDAHIQHLLETKHDTLQERLWKLKDRYNALKQQGDMNSAQETLQQIREVESEFEKVKTRLQKFDKPFMIE